ncbi:pupal cuticle protein 27-like [Plodia interpunctella]|uniref:pupal cuticle protein 27-like n=1 Tax=Plodia interpunctella TaxID=58824 RepID=UPI002368EDBF|nr:pupal cuticle protein 27-like [Plodia interpunctella]
MILIIFTSAIAFGSAAQLPNAYLPANQGGYQASVQSQSFHSSSTSFQGSFNQYSSGDTANRRPQQQQEKNAQILSQDQEINDKGFHYSYETSNGIRSEEVGNSGQTHGGFSYKGDDGNTYTITFSAGEGGFQAQGAHIPVAPAIPAEILAGLQQNEKDEAAGIYDDGQYRPDDHRRGKKNGGQGQSFGSSNHQSSFNSNAGYQY